ncbi:hypothetical protein [uncultured Winogradskyella sp.]|uniref:hypothetical protein n=1 Tax=uncultured Winogradskyella sp. TaxID=395353 RepID=UPI0030D746F7|tara:strand:+ start:4151 stop:4942 length:792 start_codon:yes stop_codon:yes gene_type:complete
MKNLVDYLKNEKYSLIFEVIVVIIGMLLALTVDGIRDDYKENKKIAETFEKNKENLRDAYFDIRSEIVYDTLNMSVLLKETESIHDSILDFAAYRLIDTNEFKKCLRCIQYVFTPVDFHINLQKFRKISALPLYELNSSYLNNIEKTEEYPRLIPKIEEANFNIDYYYFNIERDLHDNMKDIERDIEHNVAFFKENFANYYNRNTQEGLNALDVNSSIYLNMLRARMDLMEEYTNNLEYIIEDSRELLESLDVAIEALNENLK